MARATTKSGSTNGGGQAVVGRTTHVRGRISGAGDLRVEGTIDGDVAVGGELFISEGGTVTADVQASAVVVLGSLEGDVDASGPVSIRAGAKVTGALRGSAISVEEGASLSGRIDAQFDLPVELTGKAGR